MIKLELPGIPPSLNKWSRMHWAKAREIKKQWEKDIYLTALYAKQLPKYPYEIAQVRITYYFGTKHRHDADNYTPKFLLDGLVKCGILLDDSTDNIGQPKQISEYDKNNPRTVIEIWEVA